MGFQSLAIKAKVQFPGVKLSLLLFVQFVLLKLDMQLLSLRAVCGMAKATLLSDENLPPAVCQHAVVLSGPPGLVGGGRLPLSSHGLSPTVPQSAECCSVYRRGCKYLCRQGGFSPLSVGVLEGLRLDGLRGSGGGIGRRRLAGPGLSVIFHTRDE